MPRHNEFATSITFGDADGKQVVLKGMERYCLGKEDRSCQRFFWPHMPLS